MASGERAPEQMIRDWLEASGPTTVDLDAIAETWKVDRLDAADRRRIGAALQAAGVEVEPPLARVGARDKLRLSLSAPGAPPEPATTPPEAEPEPPEPARRGEFATPERVNSPPQASRRPLAARLAPLAIGLMVIGAFAPWSKAVFVTDYGTERAGWVVLAVAVVSTLLLIVHASRGERTVAPLVVAVLGTVAVALVASELRELSEDEFVGPAWGAYASFLGSAGLVLSSVALLARRS